MHAKILNEIFSNWIQEHMKEIIRYKQVVFIPEMQEWFNICESINIIHHIKMLKNRKQMTISSHAEKTFDKI